MYFLHYFIAISIGLSVYWAVGYYNVLLLEYGYSRSQYTLVLSSLSAGCTCSMIIPFRNLLPVHLLAPVLLLLNSFIMLFQSYMLHSYHATLVSSFLLGIAFCTVNAHSNAFMGRWFYYQKTSAALGVMNSVPYTMVMLTFQCEKWGVSVRAYLYTIAGINLLSAVFFVATTLYESHFHHITMENMDGFVMPDLSSSDSEEIYQTEGTDNTANESQEPKRLWTLSFLALVLIAALGGLQLTYINTMPYIMFEDNLSKSDILIATQTKHAVMFLGSFPVGVLVDKLGNRGLINALTNIFGIIWWSQFVFKASWVRWPMVGFFSIIDAAWVSSLYALPVSMVPQERLDTAMLLVNGIQWFSCIGGLPLTAAIKDRYGRVAMGLFIIAIYVLMLILGILLYLFGTNQEMANTKDEVKQQDSLKRMESYKNIVEFRRQESITYE